MGNKILNKTIKEYRQTVNYILNNFFFKEKLRLHDLLLKIRDIQIANGRNKSCITVNNVRYNYQPATNTFDNINSSMPCEEVVHLADYYAKTLNKLNSDKITVTDMFMRIINLNKEDSISPILAHFPKYINNEADREKYPMGCLIKTKQDKINYQKTLDIFKYYEVNNYLL